MRHVRPNPERGGWDVAKPGAKRVSAHLATKEEALARAREIVRRQGGGTVELADGNGRFARNVAIEVPAGSDEPPPEPAAPDRAPAPRRRLERAPVVVAVVLLVLLMALRRRDA